MSLVEERARAVFDRYSIKEIRIPVLERAQLERVTDRAPAAQKVVPSAKKEDL